MRSRYLIGIFLGILIFALDILTKALVVHNFSLDSLDMMQYPYGGVGVFHNFLGIDFSIIYTTNKGAAWGSLPHFQIPLLILRVLLLSGLIAYLSIWNQKKKYVIPLCLVIAGALGNVFDTFYYGEVVDMFKFVLWGYHYPIFNLADTSITIGIIWLFFASLIGQKQQAAQKNG